MAYVQTTFKILALNSENLTRRIDRTDYKLWREGQRYSAVEMITGRTQFITTSISKLIEKLAAYQERKETKLNVWFVQSNFDLFDRIQLGMETLPREVAANEVPLGELRRAAAEMGVSDEMVGGIIYLGSEDDCCSTEDGADDGYEHHEEGHVEIDDFNEYL